MTAIPRLLALLLAVAFTAGTAHALSSETDTSGPASSLVEDAADAIIQKEYQVAVDLLQRALDDDPDSADAWNQLGFALRHLTRFDESFAAYTRALEIDPAHRGAREYLGELYLMTGDVPAAHGQLDQLRQLCPKGCEELEELEAAIAKHGG